MSRVPLLAACLTAVLALAILGLELAPQWGFHNGTRVIALREHVLAYGLLMLPAALLRRDWLPWLLPAAILFAALMEALQPAFFWRGALSHWLASCFGLLLVTLSRWLVDGVRDLLDSRDDWDA